MPIKQFKPGVFTSADESRLRTLRELNRPTRENLSAQRAALKPPVSTVTQPPPPERPLAAPRGSGFTSQNSSLLNAPPQPPPPTIAPPPTAVIPPNPALAGIGNQAARVGAATPGASAPTTAAPPPAAAPGGTGGPSRLSELQQGVLGTFGQSPAEQAAQQQLDALISKQATLGASEQLGLRKVEGQAIPMPFVTGQSGQIQRQTAALQGAIGAQAVPLQTQLARAQAARTGERERAQAELSFETPSLTSVAAGSSLYDPQTGEAVFTAPSATAESEGAKLLTPNEASVLGVPYGTTRADAAAMGVMPRGSLNAQDKIDLEIKLAKIFDNANKEAMSARQQANIIDTSYNEAQSRMAAGESINAASQGVLVAFQKMLDPSSVVRESEYARSPQGLSVLSRIEGYFTQLQQGGAGLTANDLKEFRDLGQQFLGGYESAMSDVTARTRTQAENYELNLENILPPSYLGDQNVEAYVSPDGTEFRLADDGLYYPAQQ